MEYAVMLGTVGCRKEDSILGSVWGGWMNWWRRMLAAADRCNQPVIEGRDKSRPFFIWPAPSSNIRPDASRRVAPTGASPRRHASLLPQHTQGLWGYNQTRNRARLTSARCCRTYSTIAQT